jgi:hypothetical protein
MEVERLRRLHTAEPMLISFELDDWKIKILGDFADLDVEERNDPRVMARVARA